MVAPFLASIEPSISPARLQRYQSPTGDPLETAVNYFWNMALCEALYCSLNAVEIALRNGLHRSLTQHFGIPHWYDGHGILEPEQRGAVRQVKDRIQRRGDAVTPDRVVSELTFGFWVVILSRPHDMRFWSANNAATLKNAFMRIPRRSRQRVTIHQQYNEIRELRNRVFHHEPLFDDHQLIRRYGEVKRGLHWLNPQMVEWVEWYDRFPDVYANGRTQVELKLKGEFGIQ